MIVSSYQRDLALPIGEHSFFLFGPRQTGKTTLVQTQIRSHANLSIDLLDVGTFLRFSVDPSRFGREVDYWITSTGSGVVFVDEIQKLPILLDEIHRLIEKHKGRLTFVMTGSSARKLKRSSANLLAGRAWSLSLFPLTYRELGARFNLSEVLHTGSLPPLLSEDASSVKRTLLAYTQTYLKEEILQEALVRNVPAFSRFLELAADQSGSLVSYSRIASETGVASKTIRDYYQLLEDTLIAFARHPFLKSARKRLTMHPVYQLFDLGVINALCGRFDAVPPPGTALYGRLFEQFIVLELHRLLRYAGKEWPLYYWRTPQGVEVDVVIETDKGLVAIEIKSTTDVHPGDLRHLSLFLKDYPTARGLCVCNAERPFTVGSIPCLPWKTFLDEFLAE